MADLQAENDRLRAEVEAYRQRELSDLRSALASAREAADHYRGEALRNAELGRQIDLTHREEIDRLRRELETLRMTHARA